MDCLLSRCAPPLTRAARSGLAGWLALAACAPLPVSAQSNGGAAVPVVLEAQVLLMHVRSEERQADVLLNRETGRLGGGRLRAGVDTAAGRVGLTLVQADGVLDYRGRTQLGLPLTTRTRLGLQRAALQAQPALQWPLAGGMLAAEVGIERIELDRQIEATGRSGSLRERLQLDLVLAGLDWQVALPRAAVASLALQWRQPWSSRLVVDSAGALDTFSLAPRHQGWPALQAALRWPLGPGLSLHLALQHEALRAGPSPSQLVTLQGRPAGVSAYPGSRQTQQSLALGLAWAL
jgi:hypothetical protein